MIRLCFDDADLQKISIAPAPNGLLETAMSVHRLHAARAGRIDPPPALSGWCRETADGLADRAGVLLTLVPRDEGPVPDLLLHPDVADFDAAVDLVGRTPTSRPAPGPAAPPPAQRAGNRCREPEAGAAETRRLLVRDLRGYFDSSLTSLWPRIRTTVAAERALRVEAMSRGGVSALFRSFGAGWSWRPPTLCVPAVTHADVSLGGHGLILLPSYFAPGATLVRRPGEPAVLIYPVPSAHRWEAIRPEAADPLGPLLGRTRAAVLDCVRVPVTTTVLARRVGVSLGSASQHTKVLRDAGLLSTVRVGSAVLHTITDLGAALLHDVPGTPERP